MPQVVSGDSEFAKQVLLDEQLQNLRKKIPQVEKEEDSSSPDPVAVQKSKSSALESLSKLIKQGEHSDTKEVYGIKWELAALDEEDMIASQKDAVSLGLENSENGRLRATKIAVLSYSIRAINGEPPFQMFSNFKMDDFPSKELYREVLRATLRTYIGKLPPTAIEKLWDAYIDVAVARDKKLDAIKNS